MDTSNFSLLVNASTLNTDPQHSQDDVRYVTMKHFYTKHESPYKRLTQKPLYWGGGGLIYTWVERGLDVFKSKHNLVPRASWYLTQLPIRPGYEAGSTTKKHDNEDVFCCSELVIAVFVVCFRMAENLQSWQ